MYHRSQWKNNFLKVWNGLSKWRPIIIISYRRISGCFLVKFKYPNHYHFYKDNQEPITILLHNKVALTFTDIWWSLYTLA